MFKKENYCGLCGTEKTNEQARDPSIFGFKTIIIGYKDKPTNKRKKQICTFFFQLKMSPLNSAESTPTLIVHQVIQGHQLLYSKPTSIMSFAFRAQVERRVLR